MERRRYGQKAIPDEADLASLSPMTVLVNSLWDAPQETGKAPRNALRSTQRMCWRSFAIWF